MSKQHAHGNERQSEKKRSQSEEMVDTTEQKVDVETSNNSDQPVGATEADKTATPNKDGSTIQDLATRLAFIEAENSNLKDQYLRKAAEFENFRKRMIREKQDAIDYANQSLLLDLIPVIDDFERAIKSSEAARDYNTLHEGIGLIEKHLVTQLEAKWGLIRFESAGTAFDPNRHEAIMMESSSKVTEPTVSEDFLKGYTLKERVVRSAKVKVMMPATEKSADENVDATSDTTI